MAEHTVISDAKGRALLESAYDAMMMDERQHDLSELDIRRFVRVLDQVWSWTFSS